MHAIFDKYPHVFGFVQSSADIYRVFRSGRIASLIGLEGLHQIGDSASVLRMYHRLGVRYVTLCHDSNNLYADAAVRALIMCTLVDGILKLKQKIDVRNTAPWRAFEVRKGDAS